MNEHAELIKTIITQARARGLDQKTLAELGQMSAETLSRKKRGEDMYVSTLIRLAHAVGLKLALIPDDPLVNKISSGSLFE